MLIFIVVLIVICTGVIYWFYQNYQEKKSIRNQFERNWGKPRRRVHNWNRVRRYHDYTKEHSTTRLIDDITWKDLNLGYIFNLCDHTVSPIGQQILYDIIRTPLFNSRELNKRKQYVNVFSNNEFRLELQILLHALNNTQAWRVPDLLFKDLPEIPKWYNFLLVIPVIAFLCTVWGIINPTFFVGLIILPVFNMVIQFIAGKRVIRYSLALSGISPLINQANAIGKLDSDYHNLLGKIGNDLRIQAEKLATLNKRVHTFLYEGKHNSFVGLFWEYLNILLLLKINMFVLSVKNIASNKNILEKLFKNIGYVDAMLSLASFKSSLSKFCYPKFRDESSRLSYKNAYHPILNNPVSNSIEIKKKGILITGSNMTGKTTFLKTMGVNQIFAQTLNICFADEATLSFCNVISSMRREDNLEEGKSFYIGEVERIKKLINNASNSNFKNLFLLDEIFRGTNTIERVSASVEVLKYLMKNQNFVLASTHDLELVDFLQQEYEFFYFSGTVNGQSIKFDYKIKRGFSSTKNAIKLLDIHGYPEKIITSAMKIAEFLEEKKQIDLK